jgi:hypothetical protein
MRDDQSLWGMAEVTRGHDLAEATIGMLKLDQWANALTRTGLGSPEGPQPDKRSAPSVPSLSQEHLRGGGTDSNVLPTDK